MQLQIEEEHYLKIYEFFTSYKGHRLIPTCAKVVGLSEEICTVVKNHLLEQRLIGGYYFQSKVPPQRYMYLYINAILGDIPLDLSILEIGPGDHPIFEPYLYPNCYYVDKNFDGEVIDFKGKIWAKNYNTDRLTEGSWENLSDIFDEETFDIVVSSHSYEHVFKPITALKEAWKVLKPDGHMVNFVPDGYSDEIASRAEMTHTLYIVPDMMNEFFHYAGGFKKIKIEQFRPNYDIVVTAQKEN